MSTSSVDTISVKGFLLKIIIWLPLAFVAWYFLTPAIVYIVALLSKAALSFMAGHAVLDVESQGNVVEIITRFASSEKGKEGAGTLTFGINAMKYGYGVALFSAMLLATPDKLEQ